MSRDLGGGGKPTLVAAIAFVLFGIWCAVLVLGPAIAGALRAAPHRARLRDPLSAARRAAQRLPLRLDRRRAPRARAERRPGVRTDC